MQRFAIAAEAPFGSVTKSFEGERTCAARRFEPFANVERIFRSRDVIQLRVEHVLRSKRFADAKREGHVACAQELGVVCTGSKRGNAPPHGDEERNEDEQVT